MLRSLSMLLSAATAFLLFLSLHRWCRDRRLSIWLTLLMGLSATWWKFSTDADTYVPATFVLMLASYLLTDPARRPVGWRIGLLHDLAMLLLNIEFRMQALNVFNFANFEPLSGGGNLTIGTSFGQTTTAFRDFNNSNDPGSRTVEFVLRLNF